MSVLVDFALIQYEDGFIKLTLTPPAAIGGRQIQWKVMKRFGGSGFIYKQGFSGYGDGSSGITVLNSGQGVLQIQFNGVDLSGYDFGCYPHKIEFLDSPYTCPAEGYILLEP